MSDPVSSVSLMPHDPTWANMAETEMARMRRVLDGTALDIQHVGSTVVERIIQLRSAGSVTVDLAEPCLGRADLVIRFPSAEVRRQIEQIIGSDTFFGIPYDLVNV